MKMRGNPEQLVLGNIYGLAAVIVLISTFAGCAAGSCLSYGHSCWGAHGKRSGGSAGLVARPLDNLQQMMSPSLSSSSSSSSSSTGLGGDVGGLEIRQLQQQQQLLPEPVRAPPHGWRRSFSHLLNRHLVPRDPVAATIIRRGARPYELSAVDSELTEDIRRFVGGTMEKLPIRGEELRDLAAEEQRMTEEEPSDILLIPSRKDYSPNGDDPTMRIGFYKLLKKFNDKLK